jgi:hypothetical protein
MSSACSTSTRSPAWPDRGGVSASLECDQLDGILARVEIPSALGSMEALFRRPEAGRGAYLSRLFAFFSEEVVLDFTLERRSDGRTFVAELKCEIEFEGYRYLAQNWQPETWAEWVQKRRRWSDELFDWLPACGSLDDAEQISLCVGEDDEVCGIGIDPIHPRRAKGDEPVHLRLPVGALPVNP